MDPTEGWEESTQRRVIVPHWNTGLIIASIAISFLGAFTSTQLMCQARSSRYLPGILVWTGLASLTFGFCSIWSLHFVAMLACELDIPIGLNVPLTVLSAILAVFFTFVALAADVMVKRLKRWWRKRATVQQRKSRRDMRDGQMEQISDRNADIEEAFNPSYTRIDEDALFEGLPPGTELPPRSISNGSAPITTTPLKAPAEHEPPFRLQIPTRTDSPLISPIDRQDSSTKPLLQDAQVSEEALDDYEFDRELDDIATSDGMSSEATGSRRSSGLTSSDGTSFGLGKFNSFRPVKRRSLTSGNPFVVTGLTLWSGLNYGNIAKGFFWSLAITSMHYSGISALQIPQGGCTLHPLLVILSALISWLVCTVGCILMGQMETQLAQQILFSIVATSGVAAMHFAGMSTFQNLRVAS